MINNFTNLKYALICSNTHRILELPATSIERHAEDDLAGVHATVDVEVDAVEHIVHVARVGGAVRHLRIGGDHGSVVTGEFPANWEKKELLKLYK